MPLDHSKATVTISVVGLALTCINRLKQNQCEVGMLRCDRHSPVMDIQKIKLDYGRKNPKCSSLFRHSLNLDENIFINVEGPHKTDCRKGVVTYIRREFDRLNDTGDEEDFRWIADLEGEEFHNRELKIKQRSLIKPMIFISEGTLYTRQKTYESLARVPINGTTAPVKVLGRFGYGMNIDITCPKDGKVILSNNPDSESPDCSISLRQEDDIQYLVTIENHCHIADEVEGTDFRLFYDAVKDPSGKQFDLRRIVETGCYAEPEDVTEQFMNAALDGFPQQCLVVSTSRRDSLTAVDGFLTE